MYKTIIFRNHGFLITLLHLFDFPLSLFILYFSLFYQEFVYFLYTFFQEFVICIFY